MNVHLDKILSVINNTLSKSNPWIIIDIPHHRNSAFLHFMIKTGIVPIKMTELFTERSALLSQNKFLLFGKFFKICI